MSDAEMQEMLESAQFLDTFLDELVYPDGEVQIIEDGIYKDILVNVTKTPAGSLLFGAGINANAGMGRSSRPEELTVSPAPRELSIVEEPQRTVDKPAARENRGPRSVKQRSRSPRVDTPARKKP